MAVPTDVTVTRQVLAEPDAAADRPHLGDARRRHAAGHRQRRGKGLLVLFHVTADTRWSDLPLSGAFVDMLRRIVSLAGATASAETDTTATDSNSGRASAGRAADARARRLRRLRVAAADGAPDTQQFHRTRQRSIIRPASTGRPKAWSRSIRWRRPTARRRSMFRRSMPALDVYRHGEPLDLRGPIFLAALALAAARRAGGDSRFPAGFASCCRAGARRRRCSPLAAWRARRCMAPRMRNRRRTAPAAALPRSRKTSR